MPKRTAKKLYQLQEQARIMFAEGKTNDAIAQCLGVDPRTTRRWRNTPEDTPQNLQEALSTLAEVKVQNGKTASIESKKQPEIPVLKPHIDSLASFNSEDHDTISRLFAATLNAIENLLSDSNLSPRDKLGCFKLVLEMKRDIQAFCSIPHQARDLTDFELVRQTLREAILSDPTSSPSAIALLKLLQTQQSLPESVLPNQEKADRRDALAEVAKMTAEEKIKLYREYTSRSSQ